MKCVKFNQEKEKIKEFIKLTKKLYSKKDNMENQEEIKKILTTTHPLSKYFSLDKFLIYKKNKVVGRFCITTYPNDDTAYIGFIEFINDKKVARFLFNNAYEFCKKRNYKSIIGPIDASFWIKYRLKINKFDSIPYTSEPYNKEYYYKLFLDNNYEVIHHYTSNLYKKVEKEYKNQKYSERYKKFIKDGYEIISPNLENYEIIIEDIYYLITNLYKDFPLYKDLKLEDFQEVFKDYKLILNPSMIKLAYYKNKMVGFYISLPNYYNRVYHTNNIFNLVKILKLKKHPKEYVMLYMGVDQNHKGLGKAIAESIMCELKENKLSSIGALARDGKVTQNYVSDLIEEQYEYVILERKIK